MLEDTVITTYIRYNLPFMTSQYLHGLHSDKVLCKLSYNIATLQRSVKELHTDC